MPPSITQGQACLLTAPARKGRVDKLAEFLTDCAGRNRTVFCFGGDSRTIYAVRDRIEAGFPALCITGICDADFDGQVDRAVLGHIAAARADVVVTDLPETRFRQFCAKCNAAGIGDARINLRGSFADFAFGRRSRFLGFVPTSLPMTRLHRFEAATTAGFQFARILLVQALGRALPSLAAGHRTGRQPERSGRG